MSFNELIKLLEANGIRLKSGKGSVRIYTKEGWPNPVRVDCHGSKEIASGTLNWILKAAGIKLQGGSRMIELNYSLVIEATEDPSFFCFYSPDLLGFTGVGNSVEDCIYKAKWGMEEFLQALVELGQTPPQPSADATVVIRNARREEVPA